MSNVFGIDVSALQAFQQAIEVTSNNVANASTPGYDVESVNLATAAPQDSGDIPIGAGVLVSGINRAFSQAAANQLNTSQSSLGQLNALQNYTSQIDNLFGTTAGGLSTALQTYYSGWSAVADNPTSTAARQALLERCDRARSEPQHHEHAAQQSEFGREYPDHRRRAADQFDQHPDFRSESANRREHGQRPGAEYTARSARPAGVEPVPACRRDHDQQQRRFHQRISSETGNPWCSTAIPIRLTTVPNQFNASQLEIASSTSNGNSISSSITSGDLGGLLSARTQAIDPALNQLGQIATAVAQSANTQQASGLDLNGQLGQRAVLGRRARRDRLDCEHGRHHCERHDLQCRCSDLG